MLTTIITASPDKYERMVDSYTAILEKTNSQLGLGINVASFSVAILSAFLAAIAIIVGYYLWKNSREQKKLFADFLERNQEHIRKQSELFITQEKQRIGNFIKELEVANKSATEEEKKKIRKLIDEYKSEKENLAINSGPFFRDGAPSVTQYQYGNSIYEAGGFGIGSVWNVIKSKKMVCSTCGKSFEYAGSDQTLMLSGLYGSKRIYCSHCGAINFAQ